VCYNSKAVFGKTKYKFFVRGLPEAGLLKMPLAFFFSDFMGLCPKGDEPKS
jgi:hypothetical protein